jgi:hypothetical protein
VLLGDKGESYADVRSVPSSVNQYPGTPTEKDNFLRRLYKKRVDIENVVSSYFFMFQCPMSVVYCLMTRISDVGHTFVDIGFQKIAIDRSRI